MANKLINYAAIKFIFILIGLTSLIVIAVGQTSSQSTASCGKPPDYIPVKSLNDVPQPKDPKIKSGSLCRGACGADCPSTCEPKPDITVCAEDSTGNCHYNWVYKGVIECGSAEFCRWHDNRFDEEGAKEQLPAWMTVDDPNLGGPDTNLGQKMANMECPLKYSLADCKSWAFGGGPYDKMLLFSNPPEMEGPFPGKCCKPKVTIKCPSPALLDCVEKVPLPKEGVTAEDGCGGLVDITLKDEKTTGSGKSGDPKIITRTYRATDLTDPSAGFSECVHTITVEDKIPPEMPYLSKTARVECRSDIPEPKPGYTEKATDNCAGDVTLTCDKPDTIVKGSGCEGDPLIIARTFRAVDQAGNSKEFVQTFQVIDTMEPKIISGPPNLQLKSIKEVPTPDPNSIIADDHCSEHKLKYEWISDLPIKPGSGKAGDPRVIERTYRVTDPCGKSKDYIQKIAVEADTCFWTGNWSTNYDWMKLKQEGNTVTGTYKYNHGTLSGTINGDILSGRWKEVPPDGSSIPKHYGGFFKFTMTSCDSFTGTWNNDDDQSWKTGWNGDGKKNED